MSHICQIFKNFPGDGWGVALDSYAICLPNLGERSISTLFLTNLSEF